MSAALQRRVFAVAGGLGIGSAMLSFAWTLYHGSFAIVGALIALRLRLLNGGDVVVAQ